MTEGDGNGVAPPGGVAPPRVAPQDVQRSSAATEPPSAGERAPEAKSAEPVAAPAPARRSIDPVDELRAKGKHVELAAFLAFLVPGLGHLYLGRLAKGAIAFLLLNGLYAFGLVLAHGECVSLDKQNGHYVAFFGQVGAGLPTGLALLNTHSYEVKKALGMEPELPPDGPSPEDPAFVARLPRLDEGLLFTTIAGLLNILLVYDALIASPGAALRRDERKDAKKE